MKPFSTIAIPHKDILEGKFTKDTFAADLWKVYKGEASEEYTQKDIFFKRTYLTDSMQVLINKVEKRLKGNGGDSVIQLQTPFGGGKTHSLIALFHKAKEIGANLVVFDGSAISPKEVLIWEEIEKQLAGGVKAFKGNVPLAGDDIKNTLSKYQPLLILIDEVTDYTISASAIKVNNSYLSDLILNFMRFLSGSIPEKCVLVTTYPSKTHYSEQGQKILNALQERTGRVSEPYSPVRDEDIYEVVQKRLFEKINMNEAEKVIDEFTEYAENEKLFPPNIDKITYKARFLKSFPFQPEVIDILYKRWGSYPKFQRTRGVLYLLASVIYSIKDIHIPFIKLSDFKLDDDRIREILIDVIGPEWNSIIFQDITSQDSGAKKADKSLPLAYAPYKLGTAVATTIFLHSFSAGPERGATTSEIKLTSASPSFPSAIIKEVVDKLTEPLTSLYLDIKEGRYLYVTEVPLTKALISKMNTISGNEIKAEERSALEKYLKNEYFEIIIWGKNSSDIPDTKKIKLVLMESYNQDLCKKFLEQCGNKPRIYRNTVIFLCPMEQERVNIENFLKKKIALHLIEKDKTLCITEEQRKEVRDEIKKAESEIKERMRDLYRLILLPSKDGFKEIDLGIPTHGANMSIDKEIYERLRNDGEILEKLSPLTIKEKYLKDKDYAELTNIFESFYKTPGEIRIINDDVFKNAIKEGVKQGLFGVGSIENGKPICHHFKVEFSPEIVEGEIIVKADLCLLRYQEAIPEEKFLSYITKIKECQKVEEIEKIEEEISRYVISADQRKKLENEIRRKKDELKGVVKTEGKYHSISLELNVPVGKLSDIVKMVNYLKSKFDQVNTKIEISARNGEISKSEYEDKIREAINQAGITVDNEEIN